MSWKKNEKKMILLLLYYMCKQSEKSGEDGSLFRTISAVLRDCILLFRSFHNISFRNSQTHTILVDIYRLLKNKVRFFKRKGLNKVLYSRVWYPECKIVLCIIHISTKLKKEISFCVFVTFVTFVRLIQIKCTHIFPSSQFNKYSIVSSSAKGYINTCISKCRPYTHNKRD